MLEVRKIRLMKSKSLDDVYLETQISIPRLSRIERGIFKPKEREVKLISKALQEPVDKIFPEFGENEGR